MTFATSLSSTLRFALLTLLVAIVISPGLHAQCTSICGDPNGTATITGADWVLLYHYVLEADWITGEMSCADVDSYTGLTMRDYVILGHSLSFADPLTCTHDSAYVPIPNSEYFLHYNSVMPPGDSVVTLRLAVTLPRATRAISMPFRVLIDGQPVSYADIAVSDAWAAGWTDISLDGTHDVNNPPGGLMAIYLVSYSCCLVVPPGRHPLGTVEVRAAPAPGYRTITLELMENPPGDNTPMVVERDGVNTYGWELNLDPWIFELTGDGNNDGALTSADIILLVNYVFKGGNSPHPIPAVDDTNCDAAVSSADILALVNHVFKGGAPPCDAASECSISASDSWTCP